MDVEAPLARNNGDEVFPGDLVVGPLQPLLAPTSTKRQKNYSQRTDVVKGLHMYRTTLLS